MHILFYICFFENRLTKSSWRCIPFLNQDQALFSGLLSQVLAGEESDITTSMLNTEDADTPINELVYSIESTINGLVALKVEPDEEIQNFTQAQINNGEVIFIHEGKAV